MTRDDKLTVLDALRRARARIESPERWCQGALARDRHGRIVSHYSPEAIRWCGWGAVAAELYNHYLRYLAFNVLEPPRTCFFFINDIAGHAAVMRRFKAAIKTLEKELNT